jgi:hypothetical protein
MDQYWKTGPDNVSVLNGVQTNKQTKVKRNSKGGFYTAQYIIH